MLRAPAKGIDYLLIEPLWKRPKRLALVGLATINMFAAFICVVSFVVSDTPAQALAQRRVVFPATWEAGVWNHGSYYEWYSLAQHPILFIMSLVWFAASIAAMSYAQRWLRSGAPK
jgi:hypothetical protein